MTRGANAPSIEVVLLVTNMSKKPNYKFWYRLWFVAAALYLLAGIYPLSVAQRTPEHRNFSIAMSLFYILIGISFKKRYQKSLIEAPATLSNTKISQ